MASTTRAHPNQGPHHHHHHHVHHLPPPPRGPPTTTTTWYTYHHHHVVHLTSHQARGAMEITVDEQANSSATYHVEIPP